MIPAAAAHAAGFSGNFNGIATAAGMTLNLQEVGGRVVGRLSLPGGQSYALNGERNAKGAQGTLRAGSAADSTAFFRLEERPLGVQFLFIPLKADGGPNVIEAHDYSFVAEGVAVSAKTKFLAAPQANEKIDVLRFIDEYRQWDPRDVARIYATLGERDRGLIQLYDHASADLLWRVCAASAAGAVVAGDTLAELLDRQQTNCESFLPLVEAAQKKGLFPEFIRRARFQFEIVRETIVCDRGQSSPSKCADVSALGAPLIVNWRDASSIMRELAGLPLSASVEQTPDQPSTDEAAAGAMIPYPATRGSKVQMQDVPLRAAIVDAPETSAAKTPSGKLGAAALKAFVAARRHGIRLPLPDPRR
ncbi:hypothetical protein [Parvibaculum sp.]|uniref:hypothetical protein n=1 Tax=Parvibaculum sp. TaxID=2024848 RepID=UPI002BCCE51F|nr:hypothetical protein [Parvibaculum sp.]HUD50978.1 hypothetical protein [Parvibaculum sp.]